MSTSGNSSSSRKKAARDKAVSDDAASATTRAPNVLLTSERACVQPRNAFLPCSNATNALCGRAHGNRCNVRTHLRNDVVAPSAQALRDAVAELQTLAARDDDDGDDDSVAAWLTGRTRHGDDGDNTSNGDAHADAAAVHMTQHELRQSWLHYAAVCTPSPQCYAHHTLYMRNMHAAHAQRGSSSSCDNDSDGDDNKVAASPSSCLSSPPQPSRRAREVASFVVCVLHAATAIANNNNSSGNNSDNSTLTTTSQQHDGKDDDDDDVANNDCCALLGHALYAAGYEDMTPPREQHTVSFAYTNDGHDGHNDSGDATWWRSRGVCDAQGCLMTTTTTAAGATRTTRKTRTAPRMTCVRYATSHHINVCCGLCYYTLRVLDDGTRGVCGVAELAVALDAVRAHARQWREALATRDVGAEVQDDVRAMHCLLARMSSLHDALRIDVHRRLCEAGEANAYALEQLASALFTLVLDDDDDDSGDEGNDKNNNSNKSEDDDDVAAAALCTRQGRRGAQWLHSVLSVYAPWRRRGVFVLRAHATVVSAASLQHFARRIAATAATTNDGDYVAVEAARALAGGVVRRRSSNGGGGEHDVDELYSAVRRSSNSDSNGPDANKKKGCCVTLRNGLHFLDLWLPLKHRKALRPYAACVPSLRWRTLPLPRRQQQEQDDEGGAWDDCLRIADVCLATLAAVTTVLQTNKDDDCTDASDQRRQRRPRVLFALQHPHHTAPSATLVYSREVELYLQTLHTLSSTTPTATDGRLRQQMPPPPLHTREVCARARTAALHSVAARLHACAQSPLPLYWLAAQSCAARNNKDTKQTTATGKRDVAAMPLLPIVDVCITAGVVRRRDAHVPLHCSRGDKADEASCVVAHTHTNKRRADKDDDTNNSALQLTTAAVHTDLALPARVYVHCMASDTPQPPSSSPSSRVADEHTRVARAAVEHVIVGTRAQHASFASDVYARLRDELTRAPPPVCA